MSNSERVNTCFGCGNRDASSDCLHCPTCEAKIIECHMTKGTVRWEDCPCLECHSRRADKNSIGTLGMALADRTKERDALQSQVAELQASLDKSAFTINNLRGRLTYAKRLRSKGYSDRTLLDIILKGIEDTGIATPDAEQNTDAVMRTLTDWAKERGALEAEIDDLDTEVADLIRERDAAGRNSKALMDRLGHIWKRLDEAVGQHMDIDPAITLLAEAKTERDEIQARLTAVNAEFDERTEQNRHLTAEVKRLKAESFQWERKAGVGEDRLQAALHQVDELRLQVDQRTNERDEWQQKHATLMTDFITLERRIEGMKRLNDIVQKAATQAEQEILWESKRTIRQSIGVLEFFREQFRSPAPEWQYMVSLMLSTPEQTILDDTLQSLEGLRRLLGWFETPEETTSVIDQKEGAEC